MVSNTNTVLIVSKKNSVYIDEAYMLAQTLGLNVTQTYIVKRPNPNYYISLHISRKIQELIDSDNINLVVIYDDVKPRQIVNLMKELRVEIWDRTRLILEIFSLHAGSKEAKLQIELARIKHEIPLIKEYIRQAKLKELPGFLGPGRYAIDAYYRMLRSREAIIRRKLKELKNRRISRIKNRKEQGLLHIALTGYTSAGKTTLFNTLSGERKPTGPEAFTTLHPKVKRIHVNGIDAVISDTVGFIRDVPVEIIEAFHATLAEIVHSDIIILVLDASDKDPDMIEKLELSLNILRRIGVSGKPILIALNKIDLLESYDEIARKAKVVEGISKQIYNNIQSVIPISALKKVNIDHLRKELWEVLSSLNGRRYMS